MNRKQWIIAGIIVIVLLAMGIGNALLRGGNSNAPAGIGRMAPVSDLPYCSEEQVKPCVVSFSVDVEENMLVNLLLPDLSFPNFYLKVKRGESETDYQCQRVGTALNNAFCTGEQLPPGEILHLMLISTKDEAILAEGDLSIIGLAFPTMEVVSPTPAPTGSPAATAPTESPAFILPTPTTLQPSTLPTNPSYPNPSYPNPSYP